MVEISLEMLLHQWCKYECIKTTPQLGHMVGRTCSDWSIRADSVDILKINWFPVLPQQNLGQAPAPAGTVSLCLSFSFLVLLSLLSLLSLVVAVVVDRFRPRFEVAAGIEFARLGVILIRVKKVNNLSHCQTTTNWILISHTCFPIINPFMPVDLLDKWFLDPWYFKFLNTCCWWL